MRHELRIRLDAILEGYCAHFAALMLEKYWKINDDWQIELDDGATYALRDVVEAVDYFKDLAEDCKRCEEFFKLSKSVGERIKEWRAKFLMSSHDGEFPRLKDWLENTNETLDKARKDGRL